MLHISTKQKHRFAFALFLTMLLAFCGTNFFTQTAKAAADIDHVQDLADILTDDEEAKLREDCISYSDLNEIDIFILSVSAQIALALPFSDIGARLPLLIHRPFGRLCPAGISLFAFEHLFDFGFDRLFPLGLLHRFGIQRDNVSLNVSLGGSA